MEGKEQAKVPVQAIDDELLGILPSTPPPMPEAAKALTAAGFLESLKSVFVLRYSYRLCGVGRPCRCFP